MSQPATPRTFWIANGVVIAATLAVGALMTLAWVEGRAIEATLVERGEMLRAMLK